MKRTKRLLLLLELIMSVAFISCSSNDSDEDKHFTTTYDINLTGTIWHAWEFDNLHELSSEQIYYVFNTDGTAQTVVYKKDEDKNYFYKNKIHYWSYEQTITPIQNINGLGEYSDWYYDGYIYLIYGEKSLYKYVSCQSYPDDTYVLCFNNFDSRKKYNYFDKHVKPVNSLPSSNYIDLEGNNYFGGGSGTGGGTSDPTSGFTIEKVSVYGVTVGKNGGTPSGSYYNYYKWTSKVGGKIFLCNSSTDSGGSHLLGVASKNSSSSCEGLKLPKSYSYVVTNYASVGVTKYYYFN